MFLKDSLKLPDGRFLLRACLMWIISASVLLLAASAAANMLGLGERGLGYLSSAASFLASAAAGFAAAPSYRKANLITALTAATTLVIILLTVGMLIKGEGMSPSGILSIVSFTYAGMVLGVSLTPRKSSHGKRNHYS